MGYVRGNSQICERNQDAPLSPSRDSFAPINDYFGCHGPQETRGLLPNGGVASTKCELNHGMSERSSHLNVRITIGLGLVLRRKTVSAVDVILPFSQIMGHEHYH